MSSCGNGCDSLGIELGRWPNDARYNATIDDVPIGDPVSFFKKGAVHFYKVIINNYETVQIWVEDLDKW